MAKRDVEVGSGNVFADLGLPGAEEHLVKAQLVAKISDIIKYSGLTQTEAAKLLGISQPDVSRLLRGNFRDYSLARLLKILTLLGRNIEIRIGRRRAQQPGRLAVKAA